MSSDKKLVNIYTQMIDSVYSVCKNKHDESLPIIDQAIEDVRLAIINEKSITKRRGG